MATVSQCLYLHCNMRGRTFRKRKSKITSSSEKDTSLYILSKWMGERGFRPSKKLRPHVFNDSGRGLMTKETIRPGDVIISIPQTLLITPKLVLNSYLGNFFQRYQPKATGHEILSVFLMCEFIKGQASEWHPYISTLPEKYTVPIYFCEHLLHALPKPIYTCVKLQCDSVKNSFLQLAPLLDELQTALPIFKDVLNYDLYKWAWSSVNTRCIYMECLEKCCNTKCTFHLALAPFLDLLNHSADVQIQAGFNKEKQQYEIISQNFFNKYSQVFISYGCHDNQKLFLEYGFVIDENYNDSISFSADDILLAYQLCNLPSSSFHPKLKFINDNNLLSNAVCSMDGISWNSLIILKVLISQYDIRLWNSFIHDAYCQKTDQPDFQKLKMSLISVKINQYKLSLPNINCSECPYYQGIVSKLCLIFNSILTKNLN